MAMELHARTRRDLEPDPEFDPICALFYCFSSDAPLPDAGGTQLTGAIMVDKDHQATARGENSCEGLSPVLVLKAEPVSCSCRSQGDGAAAGSVRCVRAAGDLRQRGEDAVPGARLYHEEVCSERSTATEVQNHGAEPGFIPSGWTQTSCWATRCRCVPGVTSSSGPPCWEWTCASSCPECQVQAGVRFQSRTSDEGQKVSVRQRKSRKPKTFKKKQIQNLPEHLFWPLPLRPGLLLFSGDSKENRFAAEKDEYGADTMTEIHIIGRVTLNLWRVMKSEVGVLEIQHIHPKSGKYNHVRNFYFYSF